MNWSRRRNTLCDLRCWRSEEQLPVCESTERDNVEVDEAFLDEGELSENGPGFLNACALEEDGDARAVQSEVDVAKDTPLVRIPCVPRLRHEMRLVLREGGTWEWLVEAENFHVEALFSAPGAVSFDHSLEFAL